MRWASPPDNVADKPVERQIVQADVVQELQPLANFDQNLVRDGRLFRGQFERIEKRLRFRDVHAHDIGEILAADPYIERLFAQPRAVAVGTSCVPAIAAQKDADVQLVFLGFEMVEEAANAAEAGPPLIT